MARKRTKRRPAARKANPHRAGQNKAPPRFGVDTGDVKADSTLRWIRDVADVTVLDDGTISYTWRGRLPKQMVDAVHTAARKGYVSTRDGRRTTTHAWQSDDGGRTLAFTHGNLKSTWRDVGFTANDYRDVPEHRADAYGKACKRGLTRAEVDRGERLYYVDLHSNNHTYDRRECFRSAEPVGWVLTGVPARGSLLHAVSWHLTKRGADMAADVERNRSPKRYKRVRVRQAKEDKAATKRTDKT
jgi:hypothetical protein